MKWNVIVLDCLGYRFIGEGYATLDRRPYRFKDRVDVQLKFKSQAKNGLIFLAGKNQYFMSIELVDGKVRFQFRMGDETVSMTSPETYNDGLWHTIEAARHNRKGILKVNTIYYSIQFRHLLINEWMH